MKKAEREALAWEFAKELPLQAPSNVVEDVKQKQKDGVFLYRSAWVTDYMTGLKERAIEGLCTYCGKKSYLPRTQVSEGCWGNYALRLGFIDPADNLPKKTGSTCICPECGKGMDAVHITAFKTTYVIDKTFFMTAHNVNGKFVLLDWLLFKECDKNGKVTYTLRKRNAIALIDGVPVRFTGYVDGGYNATHWENDWIPRVVNKLHERWSEDEIYNLSAKTIAGTDMEKSALDVYVNKISKNFVPASYIKAWTKYPQIENLVRSGYTKYVEALLEACTYHVGYYNVSETFNVADIKKYIDVKKVKPHEIVGLEKNEMYLLKKYSPARIAFYANVKKRQGVRIKEEWFDLFSENDLSTFLELMDTYNMPIVACMQYILRQQKKYKKSSHFIQASYLRDYWRMTVDVMGELPKELMYPKSLQKAHDEIQKRLEEKTNAEINEKIIAFAKEMEYLSFQDDETGLLIRPCKDQVELIKEGKTLSHCVASYASSFAKRHTCIFFIRKIANPDKPYFTLEYKNGMVAQNRGLKNCNRTEAVVSFEEKWLAFIKNKETKKNGNSSNGKEQQRIGA